MKIPGSLTIRGILPWLAAPFVALPINASEKSLDFSLYSSFQYNNNFRLSVEDGESVSFTQLKPEIKYQLREANWSIGAKTQALVDQYNRAKYDATGFDVTAFTSRSFERYSLDFAMEYQHLPTSTTEIDDTGFISDSTTFRDNELATVSWQYMVSPTQTLLLDGSFQKISYESDNFSDYDYSNISGTWQRALSDRLRALLAFRYSVFDSISTNPITLFPGVTGNSKRTIESETLGLSTGMDWDITPRLNLNFQVGVATVDTREIQVVEPVELILFPGFSIELGDTEVRFDSQDKMFLLDGALRYQMERSFFKLTASTRSQPSGNGTVRQEYSMGIHVKHDLTERSSLMAKADFKLQEALSENFNQAGVDDRYFLNTSVRYSYKLSQSWQSSLSLRYLAQEFPNRSQTQRSESLSGFVEFLYQPTSIFW